MKGIEYECRPVDITGAKENLSPDFKKINPYGQVPTLVIKDSETELVLFQSLAIIQYLDEAFPETTPLLPVDPVSRARVRIISDCIAAGIQPHQNLPGLNDHLNESGQETAKQIITSRFADLELILTDYAGMCCVGDAVTMADICLVPQVYNATRFGIDVTQFPLINRISGDLLKLPAFNLTHPAKQPDALTT